MQGNWTRAAACAAMAICASTLIGGCGGGTSSNNSVDDEAGVENFAARIDEGAVVNYTEAQRGSYPKMYRKLGNRVDELGSLGQEAALLALKSGSCDRVTYVGVSDQSTRSAISFFVDCANETRVTVTEAEIEKGRATDVETADQRRERVAETMADDQRLIRQAKDNVRGLLRDASSAEFGPVVISRKDGVAACGTVNSRNGFGGYSGQQRFINTEKNGIFFPEMRADFDALWRRYCG